MLEFMFFFLSFGVFLSHRRASMIQVSKDNDGKSDI